MKGKPKNLPTSCITLSNLMTVYHFSAANFKGQYEGNHLSIQKTKTTACKPATQNYQYLCQHGESNNEGLI